MCLGILSSILESYKEDHVCILGDFNEKPGSPQFYEIHEMLHEYNEMFTVTDILQDDTYTYVNNGSQNMFMAGSFCNVRRSVRVYC